MKPLILIGGGGHCKSVIDVAESVGREILGILDIPENIGGKILGYPIVGTDDDISEYIDKAEFIVAVGFIKNPVVRIKLHNLVLSLGGKLATLIASTAYVSSHATVGLGTVVMHQAVVNADAHVGQGCIINTFCNIEHDAKIGDHCHISTGAMVNGNCQVGECSFIGSQSVVVNGVSVAANTVVAAGSMVRKNIIRPGIYAGNPAIFYK
ncbi:acetyltransferase [Bacteroides sp. OttesenSCG-928-F21]|nr:acetyltransferase [Bacteroides sp. OttesenSCG-928-F21]